jgi:hypothetical protein
MMLTSLLTTMTMTMTMTMAVLPGTVLANPNPQDPPVTIYQNSNNPIYPNVQCSADLVLTFDTCIADALVRPDLTIATGLDDFCKPLTMVDMGLYYACLCERVTFFVRCFQVVCSTSTVYKTAQDQKQSSN